MRSNNQPRVGSSNRLDVREEARWSGSLWGYFVLVVWGVERSDAKIIKIQYMVTFIGRQSADLNTTTNQKQAVSTEGSMEGICNERDAWGTWDSIVLMAIRCK